MSFGALKCFCATSTAHPLRLYIEQVHWSDHMQITKYLGLAHHIAWVRGIGKRLYCSESEFKAFQLVRNS